MLSVFSRFARLPERLELDINVGGFFGRHQPIYLKDVVVRKIEKELKELDPSIEVMAPPEGIWKVDCKKNRFKMELEVIKDGKIIPAYVTGEAFCRSGWWREPAWKRFARITRATIELFE